MHGNEPSGAVALERILVKLRQNPSGLRGQLVALAGNRAGLQQRRRYIASDFNRNWTRERVARLRAAEGPLEAEDRELVELDREIAKATASRTKVYALDLHSTSGASVRKSILPDSAVCTAVLAEKGLCVVSASVKRSHAPDAAFEPTIIAWFFPVQPAGSFSTRTSFTGILESFWKFSTRRPVRSAERSSTTMISQSG